MDALATDILRALASEEAPEGTSLARLGKRLGQGASVLMRQLASMGDAPIGGVAGPGWVRVERIDARWVVHLTEAGREFAQTRSAGGRAHIPAPDPAGGHTPGKRVNVDP